MNGDPTVVLMVCSVALFVLAFLLGALLLGPAVYHKRLIRWVRRTQDRPELSADEIAARLTELEQR